MGLVIGDYIKFIKLDRDGLIDPSAYQTYKRSQDYIPGLRRFAENIGVVVKVYDDEPMFLVEFKDGDGKHVRLPMFSNAIQGIPTAYPITQNNYEIF